MQLILWMQVVLSYVSLKECINRMLQFNMVLCVVNPSNMSAKHLGTVLKCLINGIAKRTESLTYNVVNEE